jgi:2,4-dienoyl-CoA reductase-like NADH-dependent reductase (Old Yellow Enzyme family)
VNTPLAVTGGFRSLRSMADAITGGAVDFVGIARSLAIEPEQSADTLACELKLAEGRFNPER